MSKSETPIQIGSDKKSSAEPVLSHSQKITPYLWFNDAAEEAANFYVSVFNNSRVLEVTRYGEAGPGPSGTAMIVVFELEGQQYLALNGGPMYRFTEAISFYVNCDSQEEVDRFWETLSAGGEKGNCGWLKDRYGLSWQIIPSILPELLQDEDAKRAERVMKAMLEMEKIDIAELKRAYEQD